MNKNDVFEFKITDLTADGSGVGKVDNMAVFVPLTAPGDTVSARILKLKKNYAFAKCEEILTPADCRINPDCPVFSKCGGCVYRHIKYENELKFKENRVYETMKRLGEVNIKPKSILFSQPERYRNKAQYPIGQEGAGFYANHSHRIVTANDCLLSPAEFSLATAAFWQFMCENNISIYSEETKTGLVRHFYIRKGFITNEIQATVIINGKNLPKSELLVKKLRDVLGENLKSVVLNTNTKDNNVILGEKNTVIYGSEYIYDYLCGVKVRLSPNSFYQVNHACAELLYKKVKEYAAPKGETVLDLYCGTGTIGLCLAKECKQVIGVEIVKEAVNDAIQNAKDNGILNARFICGDAMTAAKKLREENVTADTVILDPPRKGVTEELLKTVATSYKPKKIVYVSCNDATLARDVKILSAFGYTLKEYTPVDMFPRTAHVETVVLITRDKKGQNS